MPRRSLEAMSQVSVPLRNINSSFLVISIILFLSFLLCKIPFVNAEVGFDFRRSVVKIYSVYNSYNFHEPWQLNGQEARQGSGAVISGHRILTNAHVVSDATFIEVRRSGQARRFTAKVDTVAHDCDLAILKVDDPSFFNGSQPLSIGDLPQLENEVTVYGFPQGGDKLSITKGVVSRVEHVGYEHSGAYLLACQIDAPINAGNSGGPVILNGQIVGVAFQGLNSAEYENIGYMVPPPVIKRFMIDIEDGAYEGVPDIGLSMQKMENPDIQEYYHLSDNLTGVLVTRVSPGSPVEGRIRIGDVIVGAEGMDIANDGTIEFRHGERTYFGYVFQQKQLGATVLLEILRDGRLKSIKAKLTKSIDFDRLVPNEIYDVAPSYFMVGGLVFERLVLNYLKEYGAGDQWVMNAPTELMHLCLNGKKSWDRMEVVVLVKALADESNKGYHAFIDAVVDKVNGRPVSRLVDVVRAFDNPKPRYCIVEDSQGHKIVLDMRHIKRDTERIMRRYKVPMDRSPDLLRRTRKNVSSD